MIKRVGRQHVFARNRETAIITFNRKISFQENIKAGLQIELRCNTVRE